MGEDEEGVHFGSTTLKGRKVPLEERGEGREGWKGERGAQRRVANGHRTGDTGQLPGLVGSRARQSRSPAPLCFAQIFASPAAPFAAFSFFGAMIRMRV